MPFIFTLTLPYFLLLCERDGDYGRAGLVLLAASTECISAVQSTWQWQWRGVCTPCIVIDKLIAPVCQSTSPLHLVAPLIVCAHRMKHALWSRTHPAASIWRVSAMPVHHFFTWPFRCLIHRRWLFCCSVVYSSFIVIHNGRKDTHAN